MKVPFPFPPGGDYVFAVRRPADGTMLDPADLRFKPPTPDPWVFPLVEEPTPNRGLYLADLAGLAASGVDGPVEVTARRADQPEAVVDLCPLFFRGGAFLTVADLFASLGPIVMAEIREGIKGLTIVASASLGRRDARPS